MNALFDKIFRDALRSAIPESSLTISEWAETYRYVSAERSARPGKWSNDVVPYLRGVMDAVTQPDVYKLVFVKSSQIAGTEFLNNVLGYYSHIDPCPILYVCETEDKAKAWSKESLAPMIRDTPALNEIYSLAKQRDANNTIEAKRFRGGHLAIGYATSPATLSSRPRRIVLCDEVDAYEPTKEGDPVELAVARTKTFGSQKKIILCSSPRDKETSTIEPAYEASDQRKLYVPCPHCGEFQILEWANVRWDDDPAFAYYVCVQGCMIEHEDKADMLKLCEWRAHKEFKGVAGFWINELYSPFSSWGEMAVAFVDAKRNKDTLKVFINTRLAQTWEETGDMIEYADISFKREEYLALRDGVPVPVEVPDGVLVLTAGVDVQGDRLECEVKGWGLDDENWSIDYRVFLGDPASPDVWEDLKEHLLREWQGADEDEVFKIKAACIDSGGHHTNEVYNFCKANAGRRFFAVKGASVTGKPLVSKYSIVGQQRVKLFTIGTETAKDKIYSSLRVEEPGPNYCHFPADREADYFKQLCSEKAITKYVMGRPKRVWQKVSPSARNEALDATVYALAALDILKLNFKDLLKSKRSVRRAKEVSETQEQNQTENAPQKAKQNSFVKGRGGFVGRNKGRGFVGGWK